MTGDLWTLGPRRLCQLIRRRELSCEETVDAHIRRIENVNPWLNALVVPTFERAVADARTADLEATKGNWRGALHGLPITIKESIDLSDMPSTAGVARWKETRAARDAVVVAHLRGAGAIVLGKTNLSQVLWFNEADNPLFGRTNNPWNLERSSGGSSGGEAALISAGGSPLGVGTDNGGSIRHPAHSCGVCGLKPSSGRLSTVGTADERIYAGQEGVPNQPGPLAREVDGLTLVLEALCNSAREGTGPISPPIPLGDPAAVDLRTLRVGYFVDDGVFRPSPAIRRAVTEAAVVLEAAGVRIAEFTPPRTHDALHIYGQLFTADGGSSVRKFIGDSPIDRRVKQGFQQIEKSVGREGISARQYLQLISERSVYRDEFIDALDRQKLDALICPADGLPALTHGASSGLGDSQSYAAVFNLVGLPAGVVPVTCVRSGEESDYPSGGSDRSDKSRHQVELGSVGLPVAVQVVARHWREDVALALMLALETFAQEGQFTPPLPVSSTL